MTDNDGVKVVAEWCFKCERTVDNASAHRMSQGDNHVPLTPLISALDEADRVDAMCNGCQVNVDTCPWEGHAHADKLRRLK